MNNILRIGTNDKSHIYGIDCEMILKDILQTTVSNAVFESEFWHSVSDSIAGQYLI